MSRPDLQARLYREEDAAEWDRFVADAGNGTLFHRRRFLGYHPPDRFEDHSLLFTGGGGLFALFPAAIVEREEGRILRSHPGSSYGGLVVADAVGAGRAAGLVEALDAHAREAGCAGVELRTHPGIFDAHRSEELLYAYAHAGYGVRQVELSTYLDLAPFGPASGEGAGLEEAIMASFSPSCRRAVRKAVKEGVEARVSEDPADLDRFWEILRDNLARRHDVRPTHTAEELAELKDRFGEDIVLVASFREERLLGGLLAFVLNDRAAHVFYFASRAEAQSLRPLNLAVLRAAEHAVRRSLRVLNLGISTEEGGAVANWGLFRFKESFGGRGAVRLLWGKDLRG
jgi:hypothetical protein